MFYKHHSSSHRLIMGKEEIDNFFCLIEDIWIFLQECLLSTSWKYLRVKTDPLKPVII